MFSTLGTYDHYPTVESNYQEEVDFTKLKKALELYSAKQVNPPAYGGNTQNVLHTCPLFLTR